MVIEINTLICSLLAFGGGWYLGHINGWNSCIDEYMEEREDENS